MLSKSYIYPKKRIKSQKQPRKMKLRSCFETVISAENQKFNPPSLAASASAATLP